MNELKNINVLLISLVDKAANKKSLIWKAEDSGSSSSSGSSNGRDLDRFIDFKKTDEEKRIAYGIVYSPNEEDSQGDFATAEEIEKAMHKFMKQSNTASVDTQHNMQVAEGVYIVENWIVKAGDALFPEEEGAWAIGIKIENDEVWEAVKKGEYGGLSMYGYAERSSSSSSSGGGSSSGSGSGSESGVFKEIKNFFKKMYEMIPDERFGEKTESEIMKSTFEEELNRLTFKAIINAMYSVVDSILYDYYDGVYRDNDQKRALIIETVNKMTAELEGFQIIKSEIKKAGKVISEANMKKLKAALESITGIMEAADKGEAKKQEILKSYKEIKKMTPEEIKKQVDDEVKKATEKLEQEKAELQKKLDDAKIDEMKKENEDLKKKVEELEKASKGSQQEDAPGKEQEVKKGCPPWLGPLG